MAGHSKWANIKHKKERIDARKAKLFSRIAKEIISAVKQGGADPITNTKLRLAMQKARVANFPQENIERNIKKAEEGNQADFLEVMYELYGYGGIGILVEAMTDNKNRTASDLRIATNKKGGSIASPGSVSYNFERKGIIQVLKKDVDEEELFLQASEEQASDFDVEDDFFIIVTPPERLYEIKEKLEASHFPVEEVSIEMIPKVTIDCEKEIEKANLELITYLEGLDDVDAVYHNMNLS